MNQPDAPFFLAVRHGDRRVNPQVSYMKAPLGKNEIGKLLKTAAMKPVYKEKDKKSQATVSGRPALANC